MKPALLLAATFLANPHFPASGPATGSFNGLHPESKLLAVPVQEVAGCWGMNIRMPAGAVWAVGEAIRKEHDDA